MDITTLFRARLDVVRNRNKALGTNATSSIDSVAGPPHRPGPPLQANGVKLKSKLFPGKKTEYYAQARELVGNIANLREYLNETRALYLNVDNNSRTLPTSSTEPPVLSRSNSRIFRRNPNTEVERMTDAEKDQLDMTVQKIIQHNQKRVFEFQKLIDSRGVEQSYPQLYIHLVNVINSTSDYLKEVCALYAEMKAIRVKRSLNFQNIAKINSPSTHTHEIVGSLASRSQSQWNGISGGIEDQTDKQSTSPIPLFPEDTDPLLSVYSETDDYSPEELQILEEENSLLLQSLSTVADEVEQIETSVLQIAQLQQIFTEKVLLQDKEISQISNVVIGTTENIKGGNEQLRQAIQQNADFRAWVLFFIIVMSLSLLFLDWYND